jgi:hypothetical protein
MGVGFKRTGSALLVLVALALVPQGAAAKSNSSCKNAGPVSSPRQFPVELSGSIEAPVLSSYGVLRRAQTPGDLLPALNSGATEVEGELSGFYPSEIRQLARLPSGQRFFLVPGLPRPLHVTHPSCFPASVRKVFEEQEKKATEPRYCIVETPSRETFAGDECGPFADAQKSASLFNLFNEGGTIALLVPDGVARVRISGPGTRVVSAPASENAYLFTPSPADVRLAAHLFRGLFRAHQPAHPNKAQRRRAERRFVRTLREVATRTEPSKVEWLDATGKVLKTARHPPAAAIFGVGILRALSG